jgi:1-acyl-sn-glycerol-3-phosphate acyltransferase
MRAAPSDRRFRQVGGALETRLTDWPQDEWQRFRSPFYRLARHAVRNTLRTWFGVRTFGPFDQPMSGSVLVACNHVSSLDPPLVGSALPFQVSFIAKKELFSVPVLGPTIRRLQAIPIRRGTADYEALDRAVELLRAGTSVLMFPEGTRHEPGQLGQPRWGFGYVARQSGRPIVPMFLRGSRSRLPRLLRRHPLEVWMGEAIRIDAILGRDARDTDRSIGREVMRRIEGLMLRSAGRRSMPGLVLPIDSDATASSATAAADEASVAGT